MSSLGLLFNDMLGIPREVRKHNHDKMEETKLWMPSRYELYIIARGLLRGQDKEKKSKLLLAKLNRGNRRPSLPLDIVIYIIHLCEPAFVSNRLCDEENGWSSTFNGPKFLTALKNFRGVGARIVAVTRSLASADLPSFFGVELTTMSYFGIVGGYGATEIIFELAVYARAEEDGRPTLPDEQQLLSSLSLNNGESIPGEIPEENELLSYPTAFNALESDSNVPQRYRLKSVHTDDGSTPQWLRWRSHDQYIAGCCPLWESGPPFTSSLRQGVAEGDRIAIVAYPGATGYRWPGCSIEVTLSVYERVKLQQLSLII